MNRRPSGYEPDELPLLHPAMFCGGQGWIRTTVPFGTDLQSAAFNHSATYPHLLLLNLMATPIGLEPTISCVTGRHVNHYTTGPFKWWAMTGSNCRHPACKAGALPAELITHMIGDPYGIRTRVTAVKGRCLRPLDQRAIFAEHLLVYTKPR